MSRERCQPGAAGPNCAPKNSLLTASRREGYTLATPPPWGGYTKGEAMENRDEVLKRTRNALGHLEGVVKMIERDDYCVDVIRQIQAVQSSLNRVSTMVLEGHLQSCVTTAIRGKSPAERERVLKEITEVFAMSSRA